MTRWLLLTITLATLTLAASLAVWTFGYVWLPEPVPTHWGLDGQADQFTPRERMLPELLLVPGLLAGWILLTLGLPWLSPRPFSVDEWRPTYDYAMALTATLMAYIHFILLAAWLGLGVDFGRWLLAGLFLFFALLGKVLGKIRRNFYVGIRTPWTLASPIVWERTHRLAGRLFVAGGLVGFVLMLVGAGWWVGAVLLAVAIIVPVIYSLVLYKSLERAGLVKTGDEVGA